MPSAWKVALGSLLGGVSGGTQGFVDQKNKMREFAIKELEARPSMIKDVEAYKSLPAEDQKTAREIMAAKSGMIPVGSGFQRPISVDVPSQKERHEAEYIALVEKEAKGKLTEAEIARKKALEAGGIGKKESSIFK